MIPPPEARTRLASIDIARGAVMVLMAVDHVRVFAGVPTWGDPGVFFTRWITHFCAPVFIFLAGTAAYLYGRKAGSRRKLSNFLLVRGAWLILLELTLLRFGWTFNFDYESFTFAGVIWVIGLSMIVLAALVHLHARTVGAIGLAIVFGHNAVAPLFYGDTVSWLSRVLYVGGEFQAGPLNVVVLYVLIPWLGVMATGYGFGTVMEWPAERRRRFCIRAGSAAVVLFIVLRAAAIYGDPRPWEWESGVLGFLNATKYPVSLVYLLMTLGPMLLILPSLENARGRLAGWLRVFGQVPFFYYVLHIPLIHVIALLISLVRTPDATGWLIANHPMMPPEQPAGYMWSLGLLYLVTAVVVVALYFVCRWFAGVKAASSNRFVRLF
jgi:uncharacterized membrane protein